MNWPANVIKSLMPGLGALSPSCKEATRLQSAKLDRRLTLLERFGLRCHLLLCKWCRRYGRQIKFLRAAAGDQATEDQAASQPALSVEARERIQRRLQSEKK
jgi:hypothetical protein